MYDVVRKGYIQVFRVESDGTETFVSRHVDEAEAIAAANTHGESKGGGRYRLTYPDKVVDVRIIVQGAPPTTPGITVAPVSGSGTTLDIIISTPSVGPGTPIAYDLEEATAAAGPFTPLAAVFAGNPLTFRRTGLSESVTRHYRVKARDSADPTRVSAFSSVASGTTFDITANAFDFTDNLNATLNTLIESNTVTIQGINTSVQVAIAGGEYSINGGAYTALPGVISNGQTLRLRARSSVQSSTPVTATLTVGTRIVDWIVRTSAAASDGYWPNWPIMHTCLVQGSSLTDTTLAPPDMCADKDVLMFQSFRPTDARLASRSAAMINILSLQNGVQNTKFYQYLTPCVTYKVLPDPLDNERSVNLELILDPVRGNQNWKVRREDGTPCETLFAPETDHQTNITVGAGLNSLGEDYATAYWKDWSNRWGATYRDLLSGVFHDVFNQRPATLFQNNGTITVEDPDYDQDGIADLRDAFGPGPGNGGRMWAEGGLNTKLRFEQQFPGKYIIPNGARWEFDYTDGSGGQPPLPLSTAPFYRKFEFTLRESVNNLLSLTTLNGTQYQSAGSKGATGRMQALFRAYHIAEKFLKLDQDIPAAIGKGAFLFHANGNNRVPQWNDLEFMRLLSLCALLVERGAPCVQAFANRVWTIDELLVQLGNPIGGERVMGTLDESTLAFTIRAPDASVGVARFWWAEFEHGIAVVRGDQPTPGVYPSADPEVEVQLPNPGPGKVWQALNGANYKNPKTERVTRNQSPTINNGAVLTTLAMKPYTARLARRVTA